MITINKLGLNEEELETFFMCLGWAGDWPDPEVIHGALVLGAKNNYLHFPMMKLHCATKAEFLNKVQEIAEALWDNLVNNNPGVEFVVVDIDDEPALAQKYKISAVPTILFLRGGMVVDHMVGLHKEADIKAKLDFVKQG